MKLELPVADATDKPLFRSRFGGLWIDRRDAHELLAERRSSGEVTAQEAEVLAQYIDEGYVVFPRAVDDELIDAYLDLFERSWDEAPPCIYAHVDHEVLPLSREYYDRISKVSCLHCCFDRASELIFPPVVLRFLNLIYDRPPVAFQTMTMRKGSEEVLHIDTGPLTLTEPMTMAASWLALEDVSPGSGELEFVPGSHSVPEYLHPGMSKGHNNDHLAYGQVLKKMKADCADRGFTTKRFDAKKGDILVWHADLLHGGAKIENPSSTRKSLVTHFMPLGVMPTFYDSSNVTALPYPNGGYCLDRLAVNWQPPTEPAQEPAQDSAATALDASDTTSEDTATTVSGDTASDATVLHATASDATASDDSDTTSTVATSTDTAAPASDTSEATNTDTAVPAGDDSDTTGNSAATDQVSEPPSDGLRRLKDHMPLSVRKVLREQVDRLTSNSRSHGPGGSNGSR